MRVTNLSVQEGLMHDNANVMVRITHDDLTEAAVSTAQTLTLFSAVSNSDAINGLVNFDARIRGFELVQKFQDTGDAAHISTNIIVNDLPNENSQLNVELNVNGTEILRGTAVPQSMSANYTSIVAKFTPTTGKALSALNKGIIDLYFYIQTGAI